MNKAAKLTVFVKQPSRFILSCGPGMRSKEREDPDTTSRQPNKEGHIYGKVRENVATIKVYGKMRNLKKASEVGPSGVSHGGLLPEGKADLQILNEETNYQVYLMELVNT